MNYTIILGLLVPLFLWAAPVHADRELGLDEKVKELKRNLELTDDQVKEVRPIIRDYKNAVDAAKHIKENRLKRVLSIQQMQILEKLDEENLQGGLPK